MKVEGCIHGRPCVGEARSGDAGLIHRVDAVTWVLLVDALGHGEVAADVAVEAIDEARSFSAVLGVESALTQIHRRLRGSRGAAATLLRFDPQGVQAAGVGNVELRVLRGPAVPFVSGRGILGSRLPKLRTLGAPLQERGRLLLFTDGVDRRAPLRQLASLAREQLCRALIDEHSVTRDDATSIVIDYTPGS